MRAILCVIGILCGLGFASTSFAAGLDQLKAYLTNAHAARGEFSQTVIARAGRKPQQSSGTFAFQRPGKFRWTYEKPYAQLLVSDGEKFWSYDQDLNQVSVKKIGEALGATPAALLAGESLRPLFSWVARFPRIHFEPNPTTTASTPSNSTFRHYEISSTCD